MHVVSRSGRMEAMRTMVESLKRQAYPIRDRIDKRMNTPLTLAAQYGQSEAVAYLIEHTECNYKHQTDRKFSINAFHLATYLRSRTGTSEERINILDQLLPLIYDIDEAETILCVDLMTMLLKCWQYGDWTSVDWFLRRFYLHDGNEYRPLVQRLLAEFKSKADDYDIYPILLALHSNIDRDGLNRITIHLSE